MSETPVQKRDWYVEHQVRAQRAAGAVPDVESIAKQTGAMLAEMETGIASGEIRVTKEKRSKGTPADLAAKKASIQAEALAEKQGGRFYERPLTAKDNTRRVKPRTGVDQERYLALCERIRMLCARSTKRRLRFGVDAMDAADFEYPTFAMDIVNETMACNMRTGIYKFLNRDDCRRARDAALERIADRSNAAVGVNWWVK